MRVPMGSLDDALRDTARFCVKRDAIPELVAATLDWDAHHEHLRLSYFLDGVPQDVDLEQLELVTGELVSSHWQAIKSAGSVYVFDRVLCVEATASPTLVFKR